MPQRLNEATCSFEKKYEMLSNIKASKHTSIHYPPRTCSVGDNKASKIFSIDPQANKLSYRLYIILAGELDRLEDLALYTNL